MNRFIQYLPINHEKYSQLISEEGLEGYKLAVYMSGNVVLQKNNKIVKHLNGDKKAEIINELNSLLSTLPGK
jgi:hypothetical protein